MGKGKLSGGGWMVLGVGVGVGFLDCIQTPGGGGALLL